MGLDFLIWCNVQTCTNLQTLIVMIKAAGVGLMEVQVQYGLLWWVHKFCCLSFTLKYKRFTWKKKNLFISCCVYHSLCSETGSSQFIRWRMSVNLVLLLSLLLLLLFCESLNSILFPFTLFLLDDINGSDGTNLVDVKLMWMKTDSNDL